MDFHFLDFGDETGWDGSAEFAKKLGESKTHVAPSNIKDFKKS